MAVIVFSTRPAEDDALRWQYISHPPQRLRTSEWKADLTPKGLHTVVIQADHVPCERWGALIWQQHHGTTTSAHANNAGERAQWPSKGEAAPAAIPGDYKGQE